MACPDSWSQVRHVDPNCVASPARGGRNARRLDAALPWIAYVPNVADDCIHSPTAVISPVVTYLHNKATRLISQFHTQVDFYFRSNCLRASNKAFQTFLMLKSYIISMRNRNNGVSQMTPHHRVKEQGPPVWLMTLVSRRIHSSLVTQPSHSNVTLRREIVFTSTFFRVLS